MVRVSLLSMLGEKGEYEVLSDLLYLKNVKPSFIYKEKSPTIVKKDLLITYQKVKVLVFILWTSSQAIAYY